MCQASDTGCTNSTRAQVPFGTYIPDYHLLALRDNEDAAEVLGVDVQARIPELTNRAPRDRIDS